MTRKRTGDNLEWRIRTTYADTICPDAKKAAGFMPPTFDEWVASGYLPDMDYSAADRRVIAEHRAWVLMH